MAPTDNKRLIFKKHIKEAYNYINLINELFNKKINLEIIDIGTGAGFPGLSLAIYYEKNHFILNDRKISRLKFIQKFAEKNGIDNAEYDTTEYNNLKYNNKYLTHFDIITFRAVDRLENIIPEVLPLLKADGYIICGKDSNYRNEFEKVSELVSIFKEEKLQWGAILTLKKNNNFS